jgi:hypothetical protein
MRLPEAVAERFDQVEKQARDLRLSGAAKQRETVPRPGPRRSSPTSLAVDMISQVPRSRLTTQRPSARAFGCPDHAPDRPYAPALTR